MAWVRISDDFYDHPKISRAGALGIALWVAGLAWCNRNLTDGLIPRRVALRLLDFEDAADAVRNADRNAVTNGASNDDVTPFVARFAAGRLVEAGLWIEEDDIYRVHDYLAYQRSAAQITADRNANAARQKAFRERRKGPAKTPEGNADRNAVTNSGVTGAPNPNPSKRTTSSSEETRADVEQVCQHLADRIAANGSKRPTIGKTWHTSARLLLDKDGRTVEQVMRCIDWCQADPFWRSVVLSMPKLREKYDQLRLKAQEQIEREKQAAARAAAQQPTHAALADRGVF